MLDPLTSLDMKARLCEPGCTNDGHLVSEFDVLVYTFRQFRA